MRAVLAHKLELKGIGFELQHALPVKCKGMRLDCRYRVDVFVEDSLVSWIGVVNRTGYCIPRVEERRAD